jgi:predicted acyltransferase
MTPPPDRQRLLSVDALRGLAIAGMIVVNNPGDRKQVFPQLLHAPWHGLTLGDCVFPLFLFLVGVCTGLALAPEAGNDPRTRQRLWRKILTRSGLLFLLGLAENAYLRLSLEALRIPGVLQRIAVVFLASAWLHLHLGRRGLVAVIAAILAGYGLLLATVPVPGLGSPSIERHANLQGWLDQLVLGRHIWKFGTTWDPEGLLSTLPAIALGLIGVLAGRWLRSGGQGWVRICGLGLALVAAGLVWNISLPFNKSLCTSSFVLTTGGLALSSLAVAHALLDSRTKPGWARPLAILGRNPLLLYVVASFLASSLRHLKVADAAGQTVNLQTWLYTALFGGWPPGPLPSLAWGVAFLLPLFLLAWVLDVRRISIRL